MKLVFFSLFFLPANSASSNYFNLIDARTKRVIEELPEFVDYHTIKSASSKLNIRAVFDTNIRVSSVRMTFDDPETNNCRNAAPYDVFNSGGVQIPLSPFEGTIPVGSSTVTATSYAKPNCKGPPGTLIEKSFVVGGCDQVGVIIDVATDKETILPQSTDITVESMPCQANMELRTKCGFPIKNVGIIMKDRNTGDVLVEQKDCKSPYYLFDNHRGDSGSIPAGEYTFVTSVNDIEHYTIQFTVLGDCESL